MEYFFYTPMQFLAQLSPVALFTAFMLSSSSAAEIKVPLIGLGWQIAFEGPILQKSSFDYPQGTIQFRATSKRFNVSLFVEPPTESAAMGTHASCRDFYWSKIKRDPSIVTNTIKLSTRPNCEVVAYRSEGKLGAASYVQDGLHCFFVHDGKWVDLHASVIAPTPDDNKLLDELVAHLTYGPLVTSKGQIETIPLENLGTASIAAPVGWILGNVLKDDTAGQPTMFTLTFFSPTDPNSNCLLTLFTGPIPPDTREALYQSVEANTKPFLARCIENKADIRELKLKKGLGAVASFTDASLVGKPIKPGDAKALATGLIVPKPEIFAVVSMFMDDAKGSDAEKMLRALETFTLE